MAENFYRLIKGHQKIGTILNEQTRLEMFCGNKYLEKGLILYEQILLSTETDTEYFQRLQARNNWSKNRS